MKNPKGTKIHLAKSHVLAIATVIVAALAYSLWAIHIDHARQSTSKAADCTPNAILVNPCRPWLGAYAAKYPQVGGDAKSQLTYHESRISEPGKPAKQVDVVKVYHTAGDLLNNYDKSIVGRANTYLMVNWKPVSGPWATAAGASYGGDPAVDAYIGQMADSIKALGSQKIFLSVWHEGENDVSTGATCTTLKGSRGSPADYVNMWHNVRAIFNQHGVSNVVWAMDYMNFSPWDCLVNQMYPGDNYVDWIVFNAYGSDDGRSFADIVRHFSDLLAANTTKNCDVTATTTCHDYLDKQWGIGEWSTHAATEPAAANYYKGAQTAIESNQFPFSKIKLYLIFDSKGGDANENRIGYLVNDAPDAAKQQAYADLANSPVFSTSTAADTTPPTVSLTAPANGATVSGTITVSANANDNNGVAAVKFYADGTLIASDGQGSDGWSVSWVTGNATNGTHTLKAVAYDAANNSATSAISVAVNNATKPVITSFTASPTTVNSGDSTTLSWTTSNSTGCSVTPGGPTNTTATSWTSGPITATTAFKLSCNSAGGTATANASVTVAPAPQVTAFSAAPSTVTQGNNTTLNWATTGTTSCSVTPGGPADTTATSWQTLTLTTTGTYTYTVTCKNAANATTSATTAVTVGAAPKVPTNVSLTSSSDTVVSGGRVTFAWTSVGSTSCTLKPGGYTASGTSSSVIVNYINKNTTYQVTCVNNVGSTPSNKILITVTSAPKTSGPIITSFYAFPSTISTGSQTVLYWSTKNVASGNCAITASPLSSTYANGRWTTPKLLATTTYTLKCQNRAGSTSKSTTVTVSGTMAGANNSGTKQPTTLADIYRSGIKLVASTSDLQAASDGTLKATTGQVVINAQDASSIPQSSLITLNPGTVTDGQQISQLTRVEYYDGQTLAETVTQPPFALSVNELKTASQHQITERDYYTDGSVAEASQLISLANTLTSTTSGWIFFSICFVCGLALVVIYTITLRMRSYHRLAVAGGAYQTEVEPTRPSAAHSHDTEK
ncbi:MAG TPA: Ig-like domain-containing protein [Candidatus Saccharimonadales bacterium]|nr:Ig-like domain-containing protein [Candidatus Saccharimonadales bacterium]